MNFTLGPGNAVHAPATVAKVPLCGTTRLSSDYRETKLSVTCKRCLKLIAAREEAAPAVEETPATAGTVNVAISLTSTVHIAGRNGYTPACGAGNRTSYFSDTDRAVSCKRCMRIQADQEERITRTAYYAGLSDAQDMDLSQADAEEEDTCHCGGRKGQHWHRCPDREKNQTQPQREADPRTGLPVVTVDGVKYVVGFVQHHDLGYLDYVDFWPASRTVGPCNVWRAYANSAPGSVARRVWDAQSVLQERNR